MGKFTLHFYTDNAAFEEDTEQEIVRILDNISQWVAQGVNGNEIRDINGNVIGEWHRLFDDEEEEGEP